MTRNIAELFNFIKFKIEDGFSTNFVVLILCIACTKCAATLWHDPIYLFCTCTHCGPIFSLGVKPGSVTNL